MIGLLRVIVAGGIGILAWDAIAAAAAGALRLDYSRFAVGSCAIYAAAGALAGRAPHPLWRGPAAGAAVAAVSGIAGWRLASLIGPDAVRLGLDETHGGSAWLTRLGVLLLLGAGLGAAGAGYARWRDRRAAQPSA
jgi:hypothetical protein